MSLSVAWFLRIAPHQNMMTMPAGFMRQSLSGAALSSGPDFGREYATYIAAPINRTFLDGWGLTKNPKAFS
jgi:hypothetical protein